MIARARALTTAEGVDDANENKRRENKLYQVAHQAVILVEFGTENIAKTKRESYGLGE